jgi:predicted HicB family RNase H-like nuclease
MNEMNDYKQMTIRIPPDIHKALKMRAAEDEKTISELVEGLIRRYLVAKQRKDA